MRNLNFDYVGAWNFLPFGPEGVEINFKNYGNIVLIEGVNRDAKKLEDDEEKSNSNGTGKSSIQEIIVYALYGKTIKRPEKINSDDVVHNKIGKDCKTIVEFDKYRICRTRKDQGKKGKNTLRLWESKEKKWNDKTEITQGTMNATQKRIDEIIGLSYESFINICIFTDDQRSCFLECDKATKREIVENLLSLNSYREWFENAKSIKKESKNKIATESKEYEDLLESKKNSLKRLNLAKEKKQQWIEEQEKELNDLKEELLIKSASLESLDSQSELKVYKDAQKRIKEINSILSEIEAKQKEYNKRLILIEEKETRQKEDSNLFLEEFKDFSRDTKYKIEEKNRIVKEIENLEAEEAGSKCTKCKGIIDIKNIEKYISNLEKDLGEKKKEILEDNEKAKVFEQNLKEIKEKQEKLNTLKMQVSKEINSLNSKSKDLRSEFLSLGKIKEPKKEEKEIILQNEIKEIKNNIEKIKEKNVSPFEEIISNETKDFEKIESKLKKKEKGIKEIEEKIPYYDFWISGFGEQGIRKWIIEGIIPDLNKRINYWLYFLIENSINLSFDNELQEKIERSPPDGDPYIYYAMSTGQRRRLNLAVGHSFAYITELSCDSIPNLIFLDEVTTNVDPSGVAGVFKMIKELSETKQVFVTTHDQDLIRLLENESKLKLIHENGFTKVNK